MVDVTPTIKKHLTTIKRNRRLTQEDLELSLGYYEIGNTDSLVFSESIKSIDGILKIAHFCKVTPSAILCEDESLDFMKAEETEWNYDILKAETPKTEKEIRFLANSLEREPRMIITEIMNFFVRDRMRYKRTTTPPELEKTITKSLEHLWKALKLEVLKRRDFFVNEGKDCLKDIESILSEAEKATTYQEKRKILDIDCNTIMTLASSLETDVEDLLGWESDSLNEIDFFSYKYFSLLDTEKEAVWSQAVAFVKNEKEDGEAALKEIIAMLAEDGGIQIQ